MFSIINKIVTSIGVIKQATVEKGSQALDIKEKEELLCSKYDSVNRILIIENVPKQDRDDLLQDIFINALRSLHQLRDPDKMDAWLWKIARNELIRYWRESIRGQGRIRSTDTEDFEAEISHINDVNYRSLEEEFDRIAHREDLCRVLKHLPRKTLVIFRLYYFEGYRLTEISKITGENVNTVKTRHARGLAYLRQFLIVKPVERRLTEEEIIEEVLERRGFHIKRKKNR
ncbi:sigma-70 family RNA polymerase sigma factor [Clostridiales bacterium]|nr:sigma-70 family RNA polymerase sigma factor [Clostridiales bacterium]